MPSDGQGGQGAVERTGLKLDAGHWRRVASAAMTGLPPLVAQPTAEATAVALDTLAELRERLGPHAPLVRELEAAIPG